MRPARGVIIAATAGFLAGGIVADALAMPEEIRRPAPEIIVDCPTWAEDSAAHLELVSFTAERAVYVCRGGF